jgi:TonB family protein
MNSFRHNSSQASASTRATRALPWALLTAALLASVAVAPVYAAGDTELGPTVTVTAARPLTTNEINYVNTLHTELDRTKRYPTSREASISHPSGTATVWVDVSRDGRVIGRGVQDSSYSQILDQMATTLVGRASYAAFPADGWTNGSTHRFVVAYRFSQDSETAEPQVAVAASAR